MSLDATRWAWQQQKLRPIQKLVLLSLADRAGDAQSDYVSWPSYAAIAEDTGADIKSVKEAIKHLASAEVGLIEDTGKRQGTTHRVIVWRLVGVPRRERNKPENGIVPKTESSRFSGETSPKTEGKRAQKRAPESTIEPTKEPITPPTPPGGEGWAAETVELPDCVPRDDWVAFCQHRREIRKPLKPTGCRLALAALVRWHAAGHDPPGILQTSIRNGWQGLVEPKASAGTGTATTRWGSAHLTPVDLDPNALRSELLVAKTRRA